MTNLNIESTPPPSWWTSKPFGFFTETLPRLYNQAVGRLSENDPLNQAMQQSQFYGTAGTVGGPISDVLRARPLAGTAPSTSETFGKARGTAPAKQPLPTQETMSPTDFLAMYGGEFDPSSYDNYIGSMQEANRQRINAINAMYQQLAESAGANVERIQDIYGGAQAGLGETYGGAMDTTEQSYASAQQQAADQLARLGIEEAAPQVVNPMALSQAESMANLAANQAAGTGAVQRFGATGMDFASQMAQVGQQQGLEATAAIIRDMAQREADAMFQREQARAAYNPYERAMQQLEFEQTFYEPQMRAQQAQAEADMRAQELQLDATLSRRDKIVQLWQEIRGDYPTDEEAWAAAQTAMSGAENLYPFR